MITFLLTWCVLSVVATLIALAMIRTGKRRHPEADAIECDASELHSAVGALQTPETGLPSQPRFSPRGHEVPVN